MKDDTEDDDTEDTVTSLSPEVPEVLPDEEPSVTRGVMSRGAITLVGTLIGAVLMFGNEILAARFLGLPIYGCYALAIVFARIGEEVSMFGFGVSVLRFVPVYLREADKAKLVGAILLAMTFPLVIGAVLIAVMWVVAPLLAEHVLHEPLGTPYLRLFAIAIPLIGFSEIVGRITRGFGHSIYHVAIREVVPRISYFSILLCLVLIDSNRVWIAGAFITSYFLACLVGAISVVKLTGTDLWKVSPKVPFREMYAYSISSYVTVLLALVMGATDYVMIGIMSDSTSAGLYRGSLQYANTLILIIHAFAAGTIHLYPVLINEERQQELNQVYRMAVKSVNYLAAPLFVIIILNRLDLLALLGDKFDAAAPTLALLLVANLIRSSTGIAPYILLVSGHQRVEMLNVVVGIGSTILFNLWLIPQYGILGAAITACITNVILAVLRIIQLKTYFKLHTLSLESTWPLIASLLIGVSIHLGTKFFGIQDGSGTLSLAIRFPVTALILALGMLAVFRVTQDATPPQPDSAG